ncbi:hypothetical protein PR048_013623 [Dryococelus australis]|uniref:Uncharacterized protein n=1 Tax=Dryococelus australis TaxID=614101 RepID=A0ABQ9HU83_9NEOP|nr:hypothetical protein PR048_013623 [Dryococelus australis]
MCEKDLRFNSTIQYFRLGIPTTWGKQQNYSNDCSICSVDVEKYQKLNKKSRFIYFPVAQSSAIPEEHGSDIDMDDTPLLFYQSEMNGRVRYLDL